MLDVESEDLHQLLFGGGSLGELAPHERAVVGGHRRVLAWLSGQGYGDVVDGELEGIASALGLEEGVCDWEQLFSVFPDPWFVEEDDAGGLRLLEDAGVEMGTGPATRAADAPGLAAARGRSRRSLLAVVT